MKSNFIIALLLSSMSLQAQPIITQADYQPLNNGDYGYYVSDSTITPGNAGANVVWDFSNITQGELFNYSVISCNGNGDCADFVGASYYIETSGNLRTFNINNSTGEFTNGSQRPNNPNNKIYSNPQKTLKFPITYLDTFFDAFVFYYPAIGPPYPEGNGFGNNIVDGYGTLKTPIGTYTNVIRKKSNYDVSYDAILGLPHEVQENYLWYQAGISHPIMRIINNGPSNYPRSVTYTNTPPKNNNTLIDNIKEEIVSFKIYPNPTTGFFRINFENQQVSAIVVKDLLGKVVFTKEIGPINNGGNIVAINTSDWAKGIYLVEVVTPDHSSIKKIIVE